MKRIYLCTVLVLSLFVLSCDSDDTSQEQAKFAVPMFKSLAAIRGNVSVSAARETHSDGKIYVAEHYLFYIAKELEPLQNLYHVFVYWLYSWHRHIQTLSTFFWY